MPLTPSTLTVPVWFGASLPAQPLPAAEFTIRVGVIGTNSPEDDAVGLAAATPAATPAIPRIVAPIASTANGRRDQRELALDERGRRAADAVTDKASPRTVLGRGRAGSRGFWIASVRERRRLPAGRTLTDGGPHG